jgi:hypothetical protein
MPKFRSKNLTRLLISCKPKSPRYVRRMSAIGFHATAKVLGRLIYILPYEKGPDIFEEISEASTEEVLKQWPRQQDQPPQN